MKNIFFSLALMLVGSFAFANNNSNNLNQEIAGDNAVENVNTRKIDSQTVNEMILRGEVTIVKILKLDTQFKYLDSCGNWWTVQYDSLFFTPLTALIEASAMICEATGC